MTGTERWVLYRDRCRDLGLADLGGDIIATAAELSPAKAVESSAAVAITWPIIVRPASGCSTLALPDFMRVPLPAARTTTVKLGLSGLMRLVSVSGWSNVS